ncbi:MAG: tRNA preQ1(34) S-adenosylmethionine ribosyltransferase-isomerase QueA [Gemmatimonadaceae bacterium]
MNDRRLRTDDFAYELPPALIAQYPAPRRDESRLMVVDRCSGRIEHCTFRDLICLVPPGDALVLNTSKVVHARLRGHRDSGAPGEVFLLKALGGNRYEALVRPGAKLRAGRLLHIGTDLDVEILETTPRRTRIVRLVADEPIDDAIERYGHIPLPPYIVREDDVVDADRYQTVYAGERGSVASPTAGLHFSRDLLSRLEENGVACVPVVLHVGAGTFMPVDTADPADHVMHEESYDVPAASAETLNATRRNGGRIWAVGTTSVRTLETTVDGTGTFVAGRGETRIFIRAPFVFRAVDKLITNFHLPRSTLLMLVAAFAGHELTLRAYREAVREGYRFYSYGDAMAVI